jgi:hypothetical protein
MLAASWWRAPYLFDLRLAAGDALERVRDGGGPVLLYHRGRTAVYFTVDDLLYPNRWEESAPAYQAVLFDVYPGKEPWFREPHRLTWILVCAKALAISAPDSPSVPVEPGQDVAALGQDALTDRFMAGMARDLPTLDRGDHLIFDIPDSAPYRRITGIRAFAALAVTLPRVAVDDRVLAGLPQQLDRAVGDAVATLAARGVRGVGLPLIDAADRLSGAFDDEGSWRRILPLVDDLAARAEVDTIVLGAYGLTERTRNSKRAAFASAWQQHRASLAAADGSPTHEIPRLAAIVLLAAILRLAWSTRLPNRRRAVAYGLGAFAAAASVAALVSALARFFGISNQPGLLLLEAGLAAAAGLFLEAVLTYDVRKEIAA